MLKLLDTASLTPTIDHSILTSFFDTHISVFARRSGQDGRQPVATPEALTLVSSKQELSDSFNFLHRSPLERVLFPPYMYIMITAKDLSHNHYI